MPWWKPYLCAAVGTKVIAIFGPTEPAIWRPIGDKVRVVSVNTACAPCSDYLNRCSTQRCLLEIPVKMVFKEVQKLIT